jgi:hypothetical protein
MFIPDEDILDQLDEDIGGNNINVLKEDIIPLKLTSWSKSNELLSIYGN